MDIIKTSNEENERHGFLEIVVGPMYSGKTSRLMETYYKALSCNMTPIVINHSDDTRYHSTHLSNHNRQMVSCLQYTKLTDFIADETYFLPKGTLVLINEAQFFEDLYDSVIFLVEVLNFRVALYGLDGDFQRKPFGKMLDLIPHCDNLVKLHAYCYNCKNGTKGIFSKRITKETGQKVIGSSNYRPLCRKCFLKTT